MGLLENLRAWNTRRRLGLGKSRGYDAASHGRLNANWNAFNDSAELTDRYSRDVIRARARDLERNSDIFQSLITAFTRNIVGKGFKLQAKCGDEKLNDRLEELWRQWCRAPNCDVSGVQSFQQMIRMAVIRKKVDGGILFVKRYTAGGLIPFKLQILEVDELDDVIVAPKFKGNKVVGGIEYDRSQRAVGYYFRQYDVEGWQLSRPVWVAAKDVIFYWTKKRPSQRREMSDMAQSLMRVRDANEYITAVSVKERIASCLGLIIKRLNPQGRAPGRQPGQAGGRHIEYADKRITPGMIMELNAGDDVSVVNPAGTGSDATQFLKLQWELIGAGQGLSYETTSRDMSNATYSSARQAAIEDEDTFAAEIEQLCEVMSEIYETFVISCELAGLLGVSDFWQHKSKYLAHYWVKSPKKWIDPLKESSANKIALQTGQKTFQDIAAEQGKDWREAMREMAEIVKYGEELGLDMGGVIFGQKTKPE